MLHQGAQALILDLRENGGGLLEEAVNTASIFIPNGTIVSTDGRAQPRQVYLAKGGAISTKIPMVVLVDHGTASAAEIVTGALQDRGRAKVVGTHTYGKGVFQEIDPLPNGGALDFTVGEYFTPNGHNLGGGGVAPRSRHHAQRVRVHEPDIEGRHRAPEGGADRRFRDQVSPDGQRFAPGGAGRSPAAQGQVPGRRAVLRARTADRSQPRSQGRRWRSGGRVGRAPVGRRGSRRVVISRRLGRPDVARDVIEALMLDRGLRRSFDPAVEHDARDAAEAPLEIGTATRSARSADVHDRPCERARFRRRDLRRAARRRLVAGLGPHRRRFGVRGAPLIDRSRGLPSRDERVRARRGRADAPEEAVERRLLAGRGLRQADGYRRDGGLRRPAGPFESSMYRSVIRSVQRLDYDRVDRIFAGTERAAEPWAAPLAAARAAAGALSRRRDRQTAVVLDSAEPDFSFDREGNVLGSTPVAQTESHRLIEQLMIAANEQVAGFLEQRKIPTLYRVHERPEATSVERLIDQLASLGVPTPPLPKGHLTPQQASDLAGEVSVAVADWVARTGRGGRALSSLVLRTLKQAYYDHRNLGHAGLASPRYCHFTSPIRRYPDLICHRGLLSAVAGEPGPGRLVGGGGRTVDVGARARSDDDRARRRRHRELLPARTRAVRSGRPGGSVRGRGDRTDRRRRVRRLRRRARARGNAARPPAARRLVGAQRAGDDASWDPQRRRDPARGSDRRSRRTDRRAAG